MENQFFVDSESLSPKALEKKHQLETDPTSRTNHMEYMEGQEQIHSDIFEKVMTEVKNYDPSKYTGLDVERALKKETIGIEELKAFLSPSAEPFLEKMAERARLETQKHFGNTVYLFTPLYIANYCENYCVYCGFNCYNHIRRMKLSMEQVEHEMKVIADSGMEEILILTGESKGMSDVKYIGEACKLARKYFRMVGIEIYPVNVEDYRYLHECGVDYVTVFQETYDSDKYETLHLAGHKRVFPYRFDAQERALMGGMRGVAGSALLGLSDFRKDALASALHMYFLQRKYPHAEISLSCPRLRPIINNGKINPQDVGERQLCQILCAYRMFLPFAGITVSSRESKSFRDGIVKICATKISAGVSTGIGDHESKYTGKEGDAEGDEQFEINDSRSFSQMYEDMSGEGLQPVLNDYLYV
ncbi:MAG TPA: 2-iminoacetate synthase ThiH [Ruminococcus sp.]|nr:2-iminoacetate synthase ThiH [Ruminococcus sp.]